MVLFNADTPLDNNRNILLFKFWGKSEWKKGWHELSKAAFIETAPLARITWQGVCHNIPEWNKKRTNNKLTIPKKKFRSWQKAKDGGQIIWWSSLIDGLLQMRGCQKRSTFEGTWAEAVYRNWTCACEPTFSSDVCLWKWVSGRDGPNIFFVTFISLRGANNAGLRAVARLHKFVCSRAGGEWLHVDVCVCRSSWLMLLTQTRTKYDELQQWLILTS